MNELSNEAHSKIFDSINEITLEAAASVNGEGNISAESILDAGASATMSSIQVMATAMGIQSFVTPDDLSDMSCKVMEMLIAIRDGKQSH